MPKRSVPVLLFCLIWSVVCATTVEEGEHETTDAGLDFDSDQSTRWVFEAATPESLRSSNPIEFTLDCFPQETTEVSRSSWFRLQVTLKNGEVFRIFFQSRGYPSTDLRTAENQIQRYLVQSNDGPIREFRNVRRGGAVLPSTGAWPWLLPRPVDAELSDRGTGRAALLGHTFILKEAQDDIVFGNEPQTKVIPLTSDLLLGLPHHTKQKNPERRFDTSDYELVPMERSDFEAMLDAGMTCLRVSKEQIDWVENAAVFYWGPGANEVPMPVSLYQSAYLGPALYYDEPAVHARDRVLRPRLKEEAAFRKDITPQKAHEAFVDVFRHALEEGAPWRMINQLKSREDFSVGRMHFPQANLYTWETMISTSFHQLSQHPQTPAAVVFEPPGRVGTRRCLPEINMTYQCQFAPDDPRAFTSLLYGFLRGAARQTGKAWGMSIYGAVDRSDTFWFQTHAYDLGATHFFFWDTYQLACVPFPEALAMARNLRSHADQHPNRDLDRLRQAAEVAILFPEGYNLGHVFLGKGPLWGIGELHLERRNTAGLKYREVMQRVLTEVERCVKLGVAFDLMWDSPGLDLLDYRQTVRILETGRIEVSEKGKPIEIFHHPRSSFRPSGEAPKLDVQIMPAKGIEKGEAFVVTAFIEETDAPVYYTMGADPDGVYRNVLVLWELYGPGEEDYRYFRPENLHPNAVRDGNRLTVKGLFKVNQAGHYRLRTATVDAAGRTSIHWLDVEVE